MISLHLPPFLLRSLLCLLTIGWLSSSSLTAQTVEEAQRVLEQAESTYRRGNPDYLLVSRALQAADASGDLRLRARANLLQARVDSSENRRTKAYPFFQRARELVIQADRADAANALTNAEAAAVSAEAARDSAFVARDAALAEVAAANQAAQVKFWSAVAAGILAFVILALIFGATVRKLRGDIKKARRAQEESESGYVKARGQLIGVAKESLQRLRQFVKVYHQRIPPAAPGTGPSQLAAHNAALQVLSQSSYESGDAFEIAIEAWCERVNDPLVKLLGQGGASLSAESMPLRLPLDHGIPFVLLYTELAGYALAQGAQSLRAHITKEGTGVTLTLSDQNGASVNGALADDELRYARILTEEIGGRIDSFENAPFRLVLRFATHAARVGAAS